MKPKGRKSKVQKPGTANGTSDSKHDQNGMESEQEDRELVEPAAKKKKGGKRSSSAGNKSPAGEETQYEVQQVLDVKSIGGVRHYLIRWKGYEPESDTWEPESTLNCPELIAEFKNKQKKANKAGKDKEGKKKKKRTDGGSAPGEEWDENEDFEVDRILDVYFKRNGQREFLVSWKGYPSSQNSWEPEDNMDCKDLITKFMEKVDKARRVDTRELRMNRTTTDRFIQKAFVVGRRASKRNRNKQRYQKVQYFDAE